MKQKIIINDIMQSGYVYYRVEPMGQNFHPEFAPDLNPKEMLELGVFGGKYLRDCVDEFPEGWFEKAKFAEGDKKDPNLNYFKIDASLPLKEWQRKGWLHPDDPRGWFQWYCRYYSGRRMPDEDERQIKRWKAIRRHIGAIQKNCKMGDLECRPRQRQAVLHWAYDAREI